MISSGKFDELKELVSPKALQEIQKNFSKLSFNQRNLISIDNMDVFSLMIEEFQITELENKDKAYRISAQIQYIPYSNISKSVNNLNRLYRLPVAFLRKIIISKFENIRRERYNDILIANYKYVT